MVPVCVDDLVTLLYSSCPTILDSIAPMRFRGSKSKAQTWFNKAIEQVEKLSQGSHDIFNTYLADYCLAVKTQEKFSNISFRIVKSFPAPLICKPYIGFRHHVSADS